MKNLEKTSLGKVNINSVSLVEFTQATAQWNYVNDDNNGMIGDVILPNLFNMPMIDLIELVSEINQKDREKAVSVNAYIGIEKYNEQQNTYQMKLYMVGMNALGQPILEHEGKSTIYDFIMPCPPTC